MDPRPPVYCLAPEVVALPPVAVGIDRTEFPEARGVERHDRDAVEHVVPEQPRARSRE